MRHGARCHAPCPPAFRTAPGFPGHVTAWARLSVAPEGRAPSRPPSRGPNPSSGGTRSVASPVLGETYRGLSRVHSGGPDRAGPSDETRRVAPRSAAPGGTRSVASAVTRSESILRRDALRRAPSPGPPERRVVPDLPRTRLPDQPSAALDGPPPWRSNSASWTPVSRVPTGKVTRKLPRGRSSVGRALAWHARGREFESHRLH